MLNLFLNIFSLPVNWQINFQTPTTNIMVSIINLHNHIFFFLTVVFFFVCWMLYTICSVSIYPQHVDSFAINLRLDVAKHIKNFYNKNITHNSVLEIVWTLVPSIILIFIALPSFSLLYATDQVIFPELTLKVIGHQWYWSYEFGDFFQLKSEKAELIDNILNLEGIQFDCYLKTLKEDQMHIGDEFVLPEYRLLSTDKKLPLPVNTRIRGIVTAEDVIHSWAVPEFGVKIDAVPGRLNEVFFYIAKPGLCFGQCSEICGVNHFAMPIEIVKVSSIDFWAWYGYTKWSLFDINYDYSNFDLNYN